jgi:FixJ family two-component response regulator
VMQGAVELIEKPFRIDCLARKVRQVLDGEAAESAARTAKAAARRRMASMSPPI